MATVRRIHEDTRGHYMADRRQHRRKRGGFVPESDEKLIRVFWVCFMLER